MANRYYSDVHPDKGVGKTESIKSSASGEPKGDPKFVPHPDNVKKDGMGFGNKAKARGKGAASHD